MNIAVQKGTENTQNRKEQKIEREPKSTQWQRTKSLQTSREQAYPYLTEVAAKQHGETPDASKVGYDKACAVYP